VILLSLIQASSTTLVLRGGDLVGHWGEVENGNVFPPPLGKRIPGAGLDMTRTDTVDSLITHTPRWMAKAMGYEGLWGTRERFWCKIRVW